MLIPDPRSEFFPSRMIPDPNFFHPGSLIPDPRQEFMLFLTQKIVLSSRKCDPGCSFRIRILIRILIFHPSRMDPGNKKDPEQR
jgi:hypothetical protein